MQNYEDAAYFLPAANISSANTLDPPAVHLQYITPYWIRLCRIPLRPRLVYSARQPNYGFHCGMKTQSQLVSGFQLCTITLKL